MKHVSTTAVLAALLLTAGAANANPAHSEGRHAAPAPQTRADYLAKAGERFDAMDTDKDGVLSPQEMRAAREAGKERRDDRRDR